jgi:uncharacterized repeat protein (TIGR01451 family)
MPPATQFDCDGGTAGTQTGTCNNADPGPFNTVAAPGVDRVNNLEQVVLANPAPGLWRARVSVLNADNTLRLPLGGTQSYSLTPITPTADLSITKAATANGAGGFNYTVTVKNNGPSVAQNIVFTDDLPPGLTPGPVTRSDLSFSCVDPPGPADIRCSSPSLASGATATFTYSANLPENAAPGASFTNTATVTSSTPDPNLLNNTAKATVKIPACQKTGQTVVGGAGNDVLCGTAGNDSITGGGGNDLIFGFGGNDTLTGGAGNDTMFGGAGADQMTGGDGNDRLFGNDGNDSMTGGGGTDLGVGGPGADTCLSTESGVC